MLCFRVFSYLVFVEVHLRCGIFFVVDVALIVELFVSLHDDVGHRDGLLQSFCFLHLTSNETGSERKEEINKVKVLCYRPGFYSRKYVNCNLLPELYVLNINAKESPPLTGQSEPTYLLT